MAIEDGYITLTEAIDYIGRNETRDTAELEDIVTSTSRLIDSYCGRHFFQTTKTRRFDSADGYNIELGPMNDLVSITTLAFDSNDDGTFDTTVPSTAYQLLPTDATSRGPGPVPYTAVRLLNTGNVFPPSPAGSGRTGLIAITGVWGWPGVPLEIKQACRIMVAEIAKLADAPLGVAGFGEFGVVRVSANMPARARHLLQPFRHPLDMGFA